MLRAMLHAMLTRQRDRQTECHVIPTDAAPEQTTKMEGEIGHHEVKGRSYLCVQFGQLLLVQVGLFVHSGLVSKLERTERKEREGRVDPSQTSGVLRSQVHCAQELYRLRCTCIVQRSQPSDQICLILDLIFHRFD